MHQLRLPRIVVTYGYRSIPLLDIISGFSDVAEIVWLIDPADPTADGARRLLARTGTVVEALALDPDAAAAALAAHAPDGIVTFYDTNLTHVAEIAKRLGLAFNSVSTAAALEDKLAQRLALSHAGLSGPRVEPLAPGRPEQVAVVAAEMTYPAVVKPRRASGSWRTARVNSAAELIVLCQALALEADPGSADAEPDYIAEEYLTDGPGLDHGFEAGYVSVESVAGSGALQHLAVTGRFPLVEPFRETGFFIPATLGEADLAAVTNLTDAALAGIGFEVGAAHTELKLTDSGWQVIEINGRIGGGVPDMLRLAGGQDLIRLVAQAAVGPVGSLQPATFSGVGYRFFYQPPPGRHVLVSIEGLDRIRKLPGVDSITVHHEPSAIVDSRDGTRTFLFAVVGVAPDHAGVVAVERLIQEVTVTYEPPAEDG